MRSYFDILPMKNNQIVYLNPNILQYLEYLDFLCLAGNPIPQNFPFNLDNLDYLDESLIWSVMCGQD